MRLFIRGMRALMPITLAVNASCAAHRVEGGPELRDRAVLTSSELRQQYFATAYDAVVALRSNWLQPRGRDSIQTPSEVQVYLDDVRLGGVETLRAISMTSVISIERFDANAATARWGVGHGSGAIYVESNGASRRKP